MTVASPAALLMTTPLQPGVIAALERSFVLHPLWKQPDRAAFLRTIGPTIRGVATSAKFGRVDDDLLDHLPALEIIASFGVGYDNVDVAAAVRHGVIVTNTPGVLDDEVADLTVGLLLATLRQIPQADRFLRNGQWRNGAFPLSSTLRGRRVGILGLGNIGKAVARRLAAFDVAIAYHGRSRQTGIDHDYHATPVQLAAACDVLIAIVPGGADTRHLVGREVLEALGPDGVFVNVSRGSVVDEAALIAALRAGKILSAGLDVFQDEPRVPQALLDLPNLVLLPHIGSASFQTRAAMGQLLIYNLQSWFERGRPVTAVAEMVHLIGSSL